MTGIISIFKTPPLYMCVGKLSTWKGQLASIMKENIQHVALGVFYF